MISNSGGELTSWTHLSGDLPSGLSLSLNNGELFIQGTPNRVPVLPVPVQIGVQNQGGSNTSAVMVAVNPSIYVSNDLSPDVVHEDHPNAGDNPSEQIFSPTNLLFANGGTGAYNDPVVIAMADGATNMSFVLDFNNVRIPVLASHAGNDLNITNSFNIQFLNLIDGGFEGEFEYIGRINTNSRFAFFTDTPYISKLNFIGFFPSHDPGRLAPRSSPDFGPSLLLSVNGGSEILEGKVRIAIRRR